MRRHYKHSAPLAVTEFLHGDARMLLEEARPDIFSAPELETYRHAGKARGPKKLFHLFDPYGCYVMAKRDLLYADKALPQGLPAETKTTRNIRDGVNRREVSRNMGFDQLRVDGRHEVFHGVGQCEKGELFFRIYIPLPWRIRRRQDVPVPFRAAIVMPCGTTSYRRTLSLSRGLCKLLVDLCPRLYVGSLLSTDAAAGGSLGGPQ